MDRSSESGYDGRDQNILHDAIRTSCFAQTVKALLDTGAEVDVNEAGQTALMLAVEQGDRDIAKILLNHGADTELCNKEGYSALHLAVQRRNTEMVRILLRFVKDVEQTTPQGFTSLMLAVREDFEVAELLLAAGADINHATQFRYLWGDTTSLHWACSTGNSYSVQWQVSHGADVNALDEDGRDGLVLAAMHLGRDCDFVSCLSYSEQTDVCKSSETKPVVTSLTGHELMANVKVDKSWRGRCNPPNTSEEPGDYEFRETMRYLLEHGANPNNVGSLYRNTPFFEAFFNDARSMAKMLLYYGADINTHRNDNGFSALAQAVENKDFESMKWLWQQGADINAEHTADEGKCLLLHALEEDNIPLIRWLIQKGADLSLIHKCRDRHSAFFHLRSETAFKLLVEAGADFLSEDDVYSDVGQLFNEEFLFEILDSLEEKRPCSAGDLEHITSHWLMGAITEQGLINAGIFLSHHSWWNIQTHSQILHVAIMHCTEREDRRCRLSAIELLLSYGCDCNHQNEDGNNSLHVACNENFIEVIPMLNAAGADSGMADSILATPLFYAVKNENTLKALMAAYSNKLDLEAADKFGSTALHWAVLQNNVESIQVLLEAGANTLSRDGLGRAPCELPTISGTARRTLECWKPLEIHDGSAQKAEKICLPERSVSFEDNNFFDQFKCGSGDRIRRRNWQNWSQHLVAHHGQQIRELTEHVLHSTTMGLFSPGKGDDFLVEYMLEIFQEVSASVAKQCPILATAVHLAGSNREGTKVGQIDEIDLIFDLNHFRNRFRMDRVPGDSRGLGQLYAVDDGSEDIAEFLDENGKLNCAKLNRTFYGYVAEALNDHPAFHFQHGSLFVSHESREDSIKFEPSISHCSFRWFSMDSKGLKIAVDIVLSLEYASLNRDISGKRLLPQFLPEPCRAVMKTGEKEECEDWQYLCRISVSEIEGDTIRKLPGQVRQGFMLLKAYRDSWMVPQEYSLVQMVLGTYQLKQAFLHCVEEILTEWQIDLDDCDPHKLTHAHGEDTNVPPSLLWSKHILQYLTKAAEDGHLSCFVLDTRQLEWSTLTREWVQHLSDIVSAAILQYQ